MTTHNSSNELVFQLVAAAAHGVTRDWISDRALSDAVAAHDALERCQEQARRAGLDPDTITTLTRLVVAWDPALSAVTVKPAHQVNPEHRLYPSLHELREQFANLAPEEWTPTPSPTTSDSTPNTTKPGAAGTSTAPPPNSPPPCAGTTDPTSPDSTVPDNPTLDANTAATHAAEVLRAATPTSPGPPGQPRRSRPRPRCRSGPPVTTAAPAGHR